MIFDEDSIQMYNSDILDVSMALIRNALSGETVKITVNNAEQFNNIYTVMGDIFDNFTYHYYAYGNNYKEHPSYGYEITEEDIENSVSVIDGYELHSDKNNVMYNELISTNNDITNENIIFKVIYRKSNDNVIEVLFSVIDRKKCEEALGAYFYASNEEWFQSDYENILTKEAQIKQLYHLLTENDYNLYNFHIDNLKYIKIICDYERRDRLFIKNIQFGFNDNNEFIGKCDITDNGFVIEYEEEHTLEDKKVEIINNNTKTKANARKQTIYKSPEEKQYHLEKQQWLIFFCIDIMLKNNASKVSSTETYLTISGKLFEESGVFAQTNNPRKALTEFNNKIWTKILQEKDEKVLFIKKYGSNYQINMSIYRKVKALLNEETGNKYFISEKACYVTEYNKILGLCYLLGRNGNS